MDAVAFLVIAIVALPAASALAAALPGGWWREDRRWELVAGGAVVALAAACGALALDDAGNSASAGESTVGWTWLPARGDVDAVEIALRREPVWLLLAAMTAGTVAAALFAQADAAAAGTRRGAAALGALAAATFLSVLASDDVVAWVAWCVAGVLLSFVAAAPKPAEGDGSRRSIPWDRAVDLIAFGAILFLAAHDGAAEVSTDDTATGAVGLKAASVVAGLAVLASIAARLRLFSSLRADNDQSASDLFDATRWAVSLPSAVAMLWRFRHLFHDSEPLRHAASVAGAGTMVFAGASALSAALSSALSAAFASTSTHRAGVARASAFAPGVAAVGVLVLSLGDLRETLVEPMLRWTVLLGSTAALLPTLAAARGDAAGSPRRTAGWLGLALVAGVSGQHEFFARPLADALKTKEATAIAWAAATVIAHIASGLALGLWWRAMGQSSPPASDRRRGVAGPAVLWALAGVAASSAPWWISTSTWVDIARRIGLDRTTTAASTATALPWLVTIWPGLCGLVAATLVPRTSPTRGGEPRTSSAPRAERAIERAVVGTAARSVRIPPATAFHTAFRTARRVATACEWALTLVLVTAPAAASRWSRALHDELDSPEIGLPLLMTILALAVLALSVS